MKRIFIILFATCISLLATEGKAQTFALKTDLVKWGTASFNIEPEVKVGPKSTLALALSWNPFTFSDNKKWRHIWIQPEYRYWFCAPFGGHFIGVHPIYSHYNAGNVQFTFGLFDELKDYRFQGDLFGAGIGYGYHWILSNRWSIEAEIGIGAVYTSFDKYECATCGDKIGSDHKVRLMPTKAAVSLIYIIK